MSTEKPKPQKPKLQRVVEIREWELLPQPMGRDQLEVLLENGYVPTTVVMVVREKTIKEKMDPSGPPGEHLLEPVIPFFKLHTGTEAEVEALQAEEEALKRAPDVMH